MPHSSGGGSSFGGTHSGSSGSSNSYTVSRTYFPGARTFVYYRKGVPHYVYSDRDLVNLKLNKWVIVFLILFFIPFIVFLAPVVIDGFKEPTKLENTESYTIQIQDLANVLGDTTSLEVSLNNFKLETGITPAILTVKDSVWDFYQDLESYAYYAYTTYFGFKDETHWLIVYSVNDNNELIWHFEGMQGNDTDSILNSPKLNRFNNDLHDLLLDRENNTTANSFKISFDNLTENVMTREVDYGLLVPLILFFVIFIVIFILTIFSDKIKGYKNSELEEVVSEDDKQKEKKCPICGAKCSLSEKNCPFCLTDLSEETKNIEDRINLQ